jgi:hypothetical protein
VFVKRENTKLKVDNTKKIPFQYFGHKYKFELAREWSPNPLNPFQPKYP